MHYLQFILGIFALLKFTVAENGENSNSPATVLFSQYAARLQILENAIDELRSSKTEYQQVGTIPPVQQYIPTTHAHAPTTTDPWTTAAPVPPPAYIPPPQQSSPATGTEWHVDGDSKWALNCEFIGGDIASQRSRPDQCGGLCWDRAGCSHFTWTLANGGTCYLKGAGVNLEEVAKNVGDKAVCGQVRLGGRGAGAGAAATSSFDWNNSGSVRWALNCDFLGGDIDRQNVRADECGGVCERKSGCTHFTWTAWNGGTCFLKGRGVNTAAVAKNTESAVCGSMIRATSPIPSGQDNRQWVLVWEEEFNGGNLSARWNFELGCSGWGNNELQCYTNNRRENARQENGILIIEAKKETWSDGVNTAKKFTSARLTSKANWLRGKFEIRARMPKGKHLWPAIWMMPSDSEYGVWPKSGEIDIAEYRGQRPHQIQGNLHFGQAWNNKGQLSSGDHNFPFEFSDDFHKFGLIWTANSIQWLVDDEVYHEENIERNLFRGTYTENGSPFDKNFYLILNLAVGGNFFGTESFDPEEANNWEKSNFEIDWVKAWQLK